MPKSLRMGEVLRLADTYGQSEDLDSFRHAAVETFPDEDVDVLFWYHPNLEALLPVLCFGRNELVWDIANELTERWAPNPSGAKMT